MPPRTLEPLPANLRARYNTVPEHVRVNVWERAQNEDLDHSAAFVASIEREIREREAAEEVNLHIGEWYRLKVKLRHMKIHMRHNMGALEAQPWYALIPQGDMQVKRFEFAQLVDIEYDSNGKALLFKFVVDPAIHPGGVIMVLRGFMSSYLVTDEMERKRKKARLRDQELKEFISRNKYDWADGPKKLRTVR